MGAFSLVTVIFILIRGSLAKQLPIQAEAGLGAHIVKGVAGHSLILQCPGHSHGTCEWDRLESSPRISVQTESCSLMFEPVQPKDGGLYKCGGSTLQLVVMVEPGYPSIVQGKGNGGLVQLEAGQQVELQCESQGGSPPADIVWREEGELEIQALEGLEQEVTRREDGLTFKTVSNMKFRPSRDRNITCLAISEQLGVKRMTSVAVVVTQAPRVTLMAETAQLGEVWVQEGKSLEIQCEVEARPTVDSYNWSVAGREVVWEKDVLILENVTEVMEGAVVKCVAQNSVGMGEGQLVLRVRTVPRITVHPGVHTVREGEMASLECRAEGTPNPDLAWVKEETGEVVGVGETLHLAVTTQTEGTYVCHALNGKHVAVVSNTGRLTVERPPSILAVAGGRVGGEVVLHCTVLSPGAHTTITWLQEGKVIPGAKLVAPSLEDDNLYQSYLLLDQNTLEGDFHCTVTNELGSDLKSVEWEHNTDFTLILISAFLVIILIILLCGLLYLKRWLLLRASEEKMESLKRQISRQISQSVGDRQRQISGFITNRQRGISQCGSERLRQESGDSHCEDRPCLSQSNLSYIEDSSYMINSSGDREKEMCPDSGVASCQSLTQVVVSQ